MFFTILCTFVGPLSWCVVAVALYLLDHTDQLTVARELQVWRRQHSGDWGHDPKKGTPQYIVITAAETDYSICTNRSAGQRIRCSLIYCSPVSPRCPTCPSSSVSGNVSCCLPDLVEGIIFWPFLIYFANPFQISGDLKLYCVFSI